MLDKKTLNEYCQKQWLSKPEYHIISREGPPHRPTFVVQCTVGCRKTISKKLQTKKAAENDAARRMALLCMGGGDEESEDEIEYQVTVLIDGDNVHEAVDWIKSNRPDWDVHMFVTTDTVVNHKIRIHRSKSIARDATDVVMIMYATHFLPLLQENSILVLVSRDKIFETLALELDNQQVIVAKTLGELEEITKP